MSYLYLGAETTSITPPSSRAPCSCHPFFLKEWLISAIPTGNAQPPHHLYSPCHVGTTVPMSAKPGLHCDLNWGLKLKSNTRIKRRVKDKSSYTSCLSHKTMKHKRNKTFVLKHKSSCARKVMEQTVGSEGVQTQLRKGLINLTTAQAQWVKRAHS